MKYIRMILSPILLFLDWITRSKPIQRSEAEQKWVDEETAGLTLYQFKACPFCIKVRRTIHRLNLNISYKDATLPDVGRELLEKGGKRKVPCLRIDGDGGAEWMYESNVIISYLENMFALHKEKNPV